MAWELKMGLFCLKKKSQVILEKGVDFRAQTGKGQQIKDCGVE